MQGTVMGAQLTLVAHYGPKPPGLARHINQVLAAIAASEVGRYFQPHCLEQIHATIVGLERVPAEIDVIDNLNEYAATGRRRAMELACALKLARRLPPLTIRFGGFEPEDRRIESFGRPPYVRSFQLHIAQGNATIIGWHHRDGDFRHADELWALRRRFHEQCGARPKYAADSDFFMTLGTLVDLPPSGSRAGIDLAVAAAAVEERIRRQIADRPVDVVVSAEDLAVVRYQTRDLTPTTSTAYPVLDPSLTATTLAQLYAG
jgi:hypothetical protein